jgi:hypothetical protein
MKWDGIEVRHAPHLTWRQAIEGDVNLQGEQVDSNHVVIVRAKTCETYVAEDGITYLDPKTGVQIPIAHSLTNAGYGKRRNNKKPKWFGNKLCWEYWTIPYYVVRHGRVYQGTIHREKK